MTKATQAFTLTVNATPPPGGTVPAMPALPSGMTRVFAEEFTTLAPLGSFTSKYTDFSQYNGTNPDYGDNVYAADSVLYVASSTGGGGNSLYNQMYCSGGTAYTAAPCPANSGGYAAFTYGQWGACAKLVLGANTNTAGLGAFGMHWLMWPTSGAWTNEVDWPDNPGDAAFSQALVAANCLVSNEMGVFSSAGAGSNIDMRDGKYHTFSVNWTSSALTCYGDGKVVATFTDADGGLPHQQMRISLQCEAATAPAGGVVLLEMPWIYINQS